MYWESAGDPELYRANFADDGVMALPVGIMDKGDVVASMKGAAEWGKFSFADLRFVEVADGVAAVVYRTEAVPTESPDPHRR